MTNILPVALFSFGGYLIGSIPWAVITGKRLKNVDIRRLGSGNAGATNVYRVLGKWPAIFVLIMDFLKGFLPVLSVPFILSATELSITNTSHIRIFVLLSIILGHAYPAWAGFKGGKGVACCAGGITVLFPLGSPFCLGVFILVLILTRYVSVASLATAWALPLLYLLSGMLNITIIKSLYLLFFIIVAIIITILHNSNIRLLFQGTERKINF